MKRITIPFLLLLLLFSKNLLSQSQCQTGIISNEMTTQGDVTQYMNIFAQSFKVESCIAYIKGIEIDFVGVYYTGMMRLWKGLPTSGANPHPIAEAKIGSELGTTGIRDHYVFFPFLKDSSPGILIKEPGTYTISFQMEGEFGGVHYDDKANFLDGEFYYFDMGDWKEYSAADLFFRVHVSGSSTGIKDDVNPESFSLYQNYPNPFNPVTTISFALPQKTFVKLNVYDVLGNLVAALVNREMPAGIQNVKFDGSGLNSGVYFYKLIAGNFSGVKKMTFLK